IRVTSTDRRWHASCVRADPMHSTLVSTPTPPPALSRKRVGLLCIMISMVVAFIEVSSQSRAEDGLQPGIRQRLNDRDFALRHPERTRIHWTCTLYGRLRPDETRTRIVAAPLTGRLARIVATDGEMVTKGDLLLEIDSEQFASLQRDWKARTLGLQT